MFNSLNKLACFIYNIKLHHLFAAIQFNPIHGCIQSVSNSGSTWTADVRRRPYHLHRNHIKRSSGSLQDSMHFQRNDIATMLAERWAYAIWVNDFMACHMIPRLQTAVNGVLQNKMQWCVKSATAAFSWTVGLYINTRDELCLRQSVASWVDREEARSPCL